MQAGVCDHGHQKPSCPPLCCAVTQRCIAMLLLNTHTHTHVYTRTHTHTGRLGWLCQHLKVKQWLDFRTQNGRTGRVGCVCMCVCFLRSWDKEQRENPAACSRSALILPRPHRAAQAGPLTDKHLDGRSGRGRGGGGGRGRRNERLDSVSRYGLPVWMVMVMR